MLYEHYVKHEVERRKFEGLLHGIDLDDKSPAPKSSAATPTTTTAPESSEFVFGRPDQYKSMSTEEREERTQKMMAFFKNWAGKTPVIKKD